MFSYYNNGRFSFPPNFDFNIIPGKDIPANIVSVVGDGDLFTIINKMNMFENMTSSSMKPMNIIPTFRNDFCGDSMSSYLNGFYCEKLKIVFIHLRSLHDSEMVRHKVNSMNDNKSKENDFDNEDAIYTKLLFYLFLLSDIVVINIIGINLDPYYVRIFAEINVLRKKFKSITENELKTVSNSIEITNNGRLVQPRLLFVFNLTNCALSLELKKNCKSLITIRDTIENKLFAILKYHNIIGSEYSLAKVQTCFPFVFIRLPRESSINIFSALLKDFVNNGLNNGDSEEDNEDKYFERFIKNQIYAFNVTKDSNGFGSESISCRNWFKACHKLFNLFSTDKLRFTDLLSNHRFVFYKKGCDLALSVAETHYKDGLPTQYSRDIHYDKTISSRQIMLTLAKGPGLLLCVKRLDQNLNKVWAVGRQICEAVSVTGQRCKHEVHLIPEMDNAAWELNIRRASFEINCIDDGINNNENSINVDHHKSKNENKNLPNMKHCSEVQLVSACNCGRRQATRRDPFDYKEANYTFYEEMTETCCFRFTRVALPENSEVITLEKQSGFKEPLETVKQLDDDDLSDQSERGFDYSSPADLSLSQNNQMLPRRSRRTIEKSTSSTEGRFHDEREESIYTDSESYQSDHSANKSTASITKDQFIGHVSKVLFLGMFTQNSDPKMAPKFSSWSLIDSGPYFSYTHASGLEYNGFVHGSNFLLPWDVPLKTRINKVRKQRVKRAFAAGNFVKAFLGFEMECPVGHRFFLAGPNNMMQGSMASHQVKDAVHGLLTKDIPLYFPCQCSKYLAQLMRIYVAVPNSNLLRVFIQPRVRPGPTGETPIFTPGSNNPIELEAGHLWVLRLPFAYEHDGHIYRQQADMRIIEECKVLKESIFYEEISDVEE